MTRQEVEKEKSAIIEQIKEYVPLTRKFFDYDASLREYSRALYDFEVDPIHLTRQKLIKEKILAKFKRLFGDNALADLQINLEEKPAFNIVDHHQPLGHTYLISDPVVSSADKFLKKSKENAIVVISSSDIPPNNYFSRITFHDKKVPFFSVSEREFTSYYIPKRKFDITERLKKADRWKEFNEEEKKFLQEHEKFLEGLDYSKCENYIDQASIIVKNTWPYVFEPGIRQTLPELLYITQEELISECLIDLLEKDNLISRTLFDESLRARVLDNFRGNVAAWRESEGKGTHFFWRKYPQAPRSLRMYLQGGKLVPHDARFAHLAVNLEKFELISLLKQREIYPNLFLIFAVLSFYAGVKPLTGFGSAIYIEYFKQAWLKTLKGTDFEDEIPRIESIDTAGQITVPIFFKKVGERFKEVYAMDAIYDGGIKKDYLERVLDMKFADLYSTGLTDIYKYYANKYIPEAERLNPKITFDDLASITFDWI